MSEPRTAIVTGAGKRVGAVVAAELTADGWTVLGHVHHADDSVPQGVIKVVAELTNVGCAKTIFDATAGLPPIRLLVNNAARFCRDELGAFDPEELDVHMAVNLRAPILLTQELAHRHRSEEDALIVNLLDSKLAAPNPDFLSYTISKYALAGLTELAARALAGRGIRVNAIAPALMLPSGPQEEANFAAVHDLNPLRRGIEVGDVIAAVRYLIDSDRMTGQTLTLDGGQRFMALGRDVQFLEK